MDDGKGKATAPNETSDASAEAEVARREALTRLGVWAAYTSPSMMVLLSSKVASAQFLTSGSTD